MIFASFHKNILICFEENLQWIEWFDKLQNNRFFCEVDNKFLFETASIVMVLTRKIQPLQRDHNNELKDEESKEDDLNGDSYQNDNANSRRFTLYLISSKRRNVLLVEIIEKVKRQDPRFSAVLSEKNTSEWKMYDVNSEYFECLSHFSLNFEYQKIKNRFLFIVRHFFSSMRIILIIFLEFQLTHQSNHLIYLNIIVISMRNFQPSPYSVTTSFRPMAGNKSTNNLRSHLKIPELNFQKMNQPSTPTTIKDIDEELRKLHQQFHLAAQKPTQVIRETKERTLPLTFRSAQTHGMQRQFSSSMASFPKPTNNVFGDTLHRTNNSLSSMDYLKPTPVLPLNKNIRDSGSTSMGDIQKSQPFFLELGASTRIHTEENHNTISSNNCNLKKQSARSGEYDAGIFEPRITITYHSSSTSNLNDPVQNRIESVGSGIVSASSCPYTDEIIKTTKPNSEYIRIKQSPPSAKTDQNVIDSTQRELDRKNNHQRATTTTTHRGMSLPRINQQKQSSIQLTGDGSRYIQTINEKSRQIFQLENTIFKLENKLMEKQEQLQKYKLDIQNIKQSHKIVIDNNNKTISKLRRDFEFSDAKRHSSNMEMETKFHKINLENQQISANSNSLQRQINSLKKELSKKKESDNINEGLFTQLKTKVAEKTMMVSELEKQLDRMRDQNNVLRKRISQIVNENKTNKQSTLSLSLSYPTDDKNQALNSILKLNEEETIRYKNNLSVKDDQIRRLQELNRELRSEIEALKNENQIEKLKRMTDVKNLETTFKIEDQVKDNEISSLNRTLKSLEDKLKYIIQEDRRKDEFMIEYLKGRADSGKQKLQIEEFFKKFELLSVNTNIVECLKREQTEIDILKTEVRKLILRK